MSPANSPDTPWSVRQLTKSLTDYIARLGQIWVEGQLSEVKVRRGAQLVFMRLRDSATDSSVSLVASPQLVQSVAPPLAEGAKVLVLASVEYWGKRGEMHLRARQIRAIGLGELLARIEQLRGLLGAEGLFDLERKRPLPLVPRRIGLICGRNSDAQRDVMVNAAKRWPSIAFEVREVAVQGAAAVSAVVEAVFDLEAHAEVDVIIITRGGGSVEDLLPFSDEGLVRAVAGITTPVVSAIGHERDRPLLDEVADLRASTPTDAARRVVPDLAEEAERVASAVRHLRTHVMHHVDREHRAIEMLRRSGTLGEVPKQLGRLSEETARARTDSRRALGELLLRAEADTGSLKLRLHALSPAATMERGYAVVHNDAGDIVLDAAEVRPGSEFRVRVYQGAFRGVRTSREGDA